MYSDLFDQLGGGGVGGRAGGGRGGGAGADGGSSSRAAQSPPPLVACKAGKVIFLSDPEGSTTTSTTTSTFSTYQCQPDTRRGEIRLVYKDSTLQWQWYDRREEKVVETHHLLVGNHYGILERIPLTGKKYDKDRIYVWARRAAAAAVEGTTNTSTTTAVSPIMQYDLYWMQDESDDKEDELVAQINQYLADPSLAAPPAENTTSTNNNNNNNAASSGTGSSRASATAATSTASSSSQQQQQQQVDALSSILENLGMPQNASSGSNNNTTTTTSSTTTHAGQGTLTLADLQGAMASMQQLQQPPPLQSAVVMAPLSEVVTPAAISSLLEHDDVRQRLLRLLPEQQQSLQYLEDNLRSPQVQQTLRTLTQALLPDDAGNMDGFYSVLANFNLNTNNDSSGTTTSSEAVVTAMTNPIQAFLDAIVASVAVANNDNNNTTTTEGDGEAAPLSNTNDDTNTKKDDDNDKKDADGDDKMADN
ncbi:hypothetical protein ACA910_014782 [Epithemia clementina (nom. ined.)]